MYSIAIYMTTSNPLRVEIVRHKVTGTEEYLKTFCIHVQHAVMGCLGVALYKNDKLIFKS